MGGAEGSGDKSNNYRDASGSLIFLTLSRILNSVVGLTTAIPHPLPTRHGIWVLSVSVDPIRPTF